MAVTSGNRAFFTVEGGGPFYVQFNPKEIKLDDAAAWKASDEHGVGKPLITYERGEPAVLSFDLIFDSTVRDASFSSHNVQSSIDALRAMTLPSVTEDINGETVQRPPKVTFNWAAVRFEGVMEKISATTLMFDAAGNAMRAKVSCTLKEHREKPGGGTGHGSQVTLSSLSAMVQGAAATTTTVQAGQTMTQVAAQAGINVRDLAKANPTLDLFEPMVGAEAVIPGSPKLADILGDLAKAVVPANFAPDEDLDPFSADQSGIFGDLGGLMGDDNQLSSAFNSAMLDLTDKAAEGARDAIDGAQDAVHALLGDQDFEPPARD